MTVKSAGQSVNSWNAEYLDSLYQRWLLDPGSVDLPWQQFFAGFQLGQQTVTAPGLLGEPGRDDGRAGREEPRREDHVAYTRQGRVDSLVYHYRDIGHRFADLDPLGTKRPLPEQLSLESFDLGEADLDGLFDPGHLPLPNPSSLRDIITMLQETYCRHIGVEYMHIQDREQRRWLQKRMEPVRNRPDFTRDEQLRVLRELIEAEGFESFLDKRYRGKKRFGLDGGESLIPLLDEIIELGPDFGVEEYTLGMAHRGRLNVLVNILHKTYDQIFSEFEEAWVEDFIEGGGDVKYHRGYSSDHRTRGGQNVRLTLSPNPSHLEFGHSVVLGRARAKQRIRRDTERKRCVPILMHGDASFPAQGIVAEMFNMMKLDGYTVGGAIHVIINNQIGFTTNPADAHSGTYCTDIAKIVEAPIFHVNGDDPEACVFVAKLAVEYRQAFKRDFVIDLWCYRKFGHNEGDEPAFTQPLMYQKIRSRESVLRKYASRLVEEGVIEQREFDRLQELLLHELDEAQTRTRERPVESTVQAFRSVWAGLKEDYSDEPVSTGVKRDVLESVCKALGSVPDGFTPHKKLKSLLAYRGGAVSRSEPLDWAMGEMLAYGTLLLEGHAVRLTGQDVERGTFSHRHAVLFDQKTGEAYDTLNHIESGQARFCIHNSPLTENACVGFEYGYSLGDPNMLVIWEAQFGDFANAAQVIFDQFIASAEVKWERFTGLTCFLPHGYEGGGPEHSSARLERFLTLCAKNNMQVVYPTTPAQMFHVLRRQMKRGFRKPLIVMTPKSLLRLPAATSTVEEFVAGRFAHVIDDSAVEQPARINRLILCSGKVYYDLLEHREKVASSDTAIVRIEQLYPFAEAPMKEILARYHHAEHKFWVQEEPRNMGAWRFMDATMRERLEVELHYVGRDENASPAVASSKMHHQEQEKIMIEAIGLAETKDAGEARRTQPAAAAS